VVSLRNLRPGESRAYLSARGVTDAQQDSVVAFTHGHPLALALVADVLNQSEGDELASYRPEQEPDLVRVLLERFVARVPSPRHRAALEACAHLRVTTESLLADALGDAPDAAASGPDAAELFGWLRGLSFMEHGPEGVFPHDLAREVLDADLRWRNPPGYRRLHATARTAILRRIQTSQGIALQRALFDFMFMHRNNPITGQYYDWESLGHTYAEPATDRDLGQILALVERHEGSESRQIAQHWYARQPAAFTVFRDVDGDLIGFMATVTLSDAAPEDVAADPAARAAVAYVRRHAPLRAGDELIHHRFFLSRDTYQLVSPATNLLAVSCCRHWLTRPRLAWSVVTVADADYWRPLFSHLNFRFSPEAAFEVGGRRHATWTHDWRAEPPLAWYELMGERELMSEPAPPAPAPAAAPLVVLSEPEFGTAVRRALRDYTRPDALATSPLLRSRVLVERVQRTGASGPEPGPADLQALLREAAGSLLANPRDERFHRALRCTYFEPAVTQERAAERLGLPFSTYRAHLGSGIERVTGWLWRRELSGQPDQAETEQ
jgi:hypothetical protein